MENKTIKVYSYNKVWKIENKIYAIQNIVLPVPILPRELFYFLGVAGFFFVLSNIFPFLLIIPTILRFIFAPYFITKFLLKKKLDGKTPQNYILGLIKYYFRKNTYVERFQDKNKQQKNIKLDWFCGYKK